MKKLSLFLAILMIAMCFASFAYAVDAPVLDETQKVTHAIKGTPTMDGEIDAAWANAEIQTIEVVSAGSGDQIKARFRVMWDENFLYVLHEVVDPTLGTADFERNIGGTNIYLRDSISFVLDVNYTRKTGALSGAAGTGYFIRGVYGYCANNYGFQVKDTTKNPSSPWVDGTIVSVPNGYGNAYYQPETENQYAYSKVITDGDTVLGYQMESKMALTNVSCANFDELTLGQLIGFDTAINDNVSGTANVRANNIFWNSAASAAVNGATKMGTIKLEAADYDNSTNNAAHASSADFFAQEVVKASKLNTTQPYTNAIKGTPTIDGNVDAMWANAEVNSMTKVTIGAPAIDGRFRVMWDEDFLYILAEVYDKTLNTATLEQAQQGVNLVGMDSLLIALDANYLRGNLTANQSAYLVKGIHGGTYTNSAVNNTSGGFGGIFHAGTNALNTGYTCDEEFFKTVITENGYVMEGKIALPEFKLKTYSELTEGQIVGLEMMVNDNTAGVSGTAGRTNQICWAGGSTAPSTYGSVILQAADYEVAADKKVAADDTFFDYRPIKPVISATQKSDVVDGKYSMRFVATVKDIEYFNGAGIEITNGTKTWTVEDTTAVYRALTGKEGDTGIVAVAAADGCYYTAYEITDIPEATEDTLTVKAFVIVDGVKTYTDEKTVTLTPPVVEE